MENQSQDPRGQSYDTIGTLVGRKTGTNKTTLQPEFKVSLQWEGFTCTRKLTPELFSQLPPDGTIVRVRGVLEENRQDPYGSCRPGLAYYCKPFVAGKAA